MLRDFQQDLEDRTFAAWQEPNVFNVMVNAPTGSGKTVLIGSAITRFNRPTCAIAHRQELVSQMSLALNRENVSHAIIAPKSVIQQIIRLHHENHGYSRYNYRSDIRVAGVDSLRNHGAKDRWLSAVGLVVQDEGHHVLATNKWGKAQAMFPNARGLFLTAHAYRADGNGLGRHASGLVDRLIVGPSCRDLINRGFLTDYDIYCPETDIDFSEVEISSATGDYSQPQLRAATHESKRLVGDVVKEYLRLAPGKLGITFAVDVEEAEKIAAAYMVADVPAAVITAKTQIGIRGSLMRQFRQKKLLQLVSVNCLGEGVDVPAIEVVSLARRTASFQLFSQQIGRVLRPLLTDQEAAEWGLLTDQERLTRIANSTKPRAIVIDHVGNTIYMAQWHGRPCSRQTYTLDDRESAIRLRNGADSLRPCVKCLKPYERFYTVCPYCGHVPEVTLRSSIEYVDGDIVLLDPQALAAMQAEISKVDGEPPPVYPGVVGNAILKNHYNRQRHQATLRYAMAVWGGWRIQQGESIREAQKRFYLTFGVDNLTACALGTSEATALEMKIRDELNKHNVVEKLLLVMQGRQTL